MAVKKKKVVKKAEPKIVEGFLLCRKKTDAKLLAQTLEEAGVRCECWPEMGILEVLLGEGLSIDLEVSSIAWEGEDQIFLENHDIATIFEISFAEEAISHAGAAFQALVKATSGVICSDTEDFYPVYAGNF